MTLTYIELKDSQPSKQDISADLIDIDRNYDDSLINILIVDENEGNLFLAKKAFNAQKNFSTSVLTITSGKKALEQLQSQEEKPDIILLGINMPCENGKEALRAIKSSSDFQDITVIMLSSSKMESDLRECQNLMADGYIAKPEKLEDYSELVLHIRDYWAPRIQETSGVRNGKT